MHCCQDEINAAVLSWPFIGAALVWARQWAYRVIRAARIKAAADDGEAH